MLKARHSKEIWTKVQEYYNSGKRCVDCKNNFGLTHGEWCYAIKSGRIKLDPKRVRLLYDKNLDLTGRRFLHFTVIKKHSDLPVFGHGQKWECRCDCGNLRAHTTSTLLGHRIKSCGCQKFQKGPLHHKWNGFESISGTFWNRLRGGARERGIAVNITKEFCWELIKKQNFICALSGQLLTLSKSKDLTESTASIDRINSSLPYQEDNIQWVHKDVNRMKLEFSEEKFLDIIRKIYETRCSS